MTSTSNSPVHAGQRPTVASQLSIDSSYQCIDLTSELEEATAHSVGGGSFSDVYKYKLRGDEAPLYFAVKQFRYFLNYRLTDEQTERVSFQSFYGTIVSSETIIPEN